MSASDRLAPRSVVVLWAVAALFLVLLLMLRVAAHALLLTFAAVLFGTSLRGLSEVVARKLGCSVGFALAACVGLLLALAAAVAIWVVPHVANQAAALWSQLRQSGHRLRQIAAGSELASRILDQGSSIGRQLGRFAMGAAGILASGVGALGAGIYVTFLALYVASDPGVYRRGMVKLVPPARRERAGQVLDALASTLRRWLLGRVVSMTAVGTVTGLALWIMGIPLSATLGLIAGLFGFVPNVGPILSAIPALLLALTVSPLYLLYVSILYLAVNLGDGYLLTPYLQKRAVSVPPGLILTSQVVLATLLGGLGVTLATPLIACLVVLTRELYVNDILERQSAGGEARAGDG